MKNETFLLKNQMIMMMLMRRAAAEAEQEIVDELRQKQPEQKQQQQQEVQFNKHLDILRKYCNNLSDIQQQNNYHCYQQQQGRNEKQMLQVKQQHRIPRFM